MAPLRVSSASPCSSLLWRPRTSASHSARGLHWLSDGRGLGQESRPCGWGVPRHVRRLIDVRLSGRMFSVVGRLWSIIRQFFFRLCNLDELRRFALRPAWTCRVNDTLRFYSVWFDVVGSITQLKVYHMLNCLHPLAASLRGVDPEWVAETTLTNHYN